MNLSECVGERVKEVHPVLYHNISHGSYGYVKADAVQVYPPFQLSPLQKGLKVPRTKYVFVICTTLTLNSNPL
jgi:hypothetical protein